MSGRLSILVPLKEQAGENLEAISFYYDDVKLSIGVTADFMQQERQIVTNGIELTTTSPITFIVSWIQPVTENNDVQTFFSVDLFCKQ